MRYTALFLLALVCLNSVMAVSLRKNSEQVKTSFAIERLRFIGKKSTIAKSIVSAVELHLTSGGKVAEVIQLVEEARQDVANRRVSLQSEYNERRSFLENEISRLENEISTNQDRLQIVNQNIDRLHGEIASLEQQISNLEEELRNLDAHEQHVNNAREVDIQTYEARKQRDQNSLNILEQIIQKLQALEQRGNAFLQVSKKEIERILSRIPKSNPLQALVQLSTKFDPERLRQVIEKLQTIQAAIQASYIEDRNGEDSSRVHYEALIDEINAVRAQKQEQLATAQRDLEQAQADLEQYQTEQAQLVSLIELAQGMLVAARAELEQLIASYESRLSEADQALAAIDVALEVLRQNRSDLENREEQADVVENSLQ